MLHIHPAANSGNKFPEEIERLLDEADKAAELSDLRCSGQDVFRRVRGRIRGRKAL